jgi:signal transduction histidine kinase
MTSPRWRQPAIYAAAAALAALALLLTLALGPIIARNQLFIFAAAVVVSAWFGGLRPGLFATLLSVLAINYFLNEPLYSFGFKELRDAVGLLAFAGMASLATWLSGDLRSSRHRAEAATRMRELLAASLSHDLKLPLTAIKAEAALLRRRLVQGGAPDLERLTSRLDQIDSGTVRMERMIEELVDLARLDSGEALALRRQPTDLVDLAERAVEEHRPLSRLHELRVEHDGGALTGSWDLFRLERVVSNLLTNALKFSPDGGEIVVEVRPDAGGQWATLAVRDHGVGIPAAELPVVFEPYRRAANVRDRISGSGIGLAGARQIVEAHGGTIAVESREGTGTTVTVRLPLAAGASAGYERLRAGLPRAASFTVGATKPSEDGSAIR